MIEGRDKWISGNYLALKNPLGVEKRYTVIGFTADPIFEAYGPFHGAATMVSEPAQVKIKTYQEGPGRPHVILPERRLVTGDEAWVDLDEDFVLSLRGRLDIFAKHVALYKERGGDISLVYIQNDILSNNPL